MYAEQISFPRSCNNIRKYRDSSNVFIKAHQYTLKCFDL